MEQFIINVMSLPIFEHVTPHNNLLNFIFNCLGVQTTFFPVAATSGQTFNLPLWYMSVLFFLYIYYYFYSQLNSNLKDAFLLLVLGYFMWVLMNNPGQGNWPVINVPTARGIVSFFIGIISGKVARKYSCNNKITIVSIFSIMFWCVCLFLNENILVNHYLSFDLLVIFPVLYLCVNCNILQAVLELKALKFFGKISLHIYVWNFPIQLAFLIFSRTRFGISFYSLKFWIINFAVHIIVSVISYQAGQCINNHRRQLTKSNEL